MQATPGSPVYEDSSRLLGVEPQIQSSQASILPGKEESNPFSVMVRELRQHHERGVTRPYKFRIKQIKNLNRMVKENEKDLIAAISEDGGKSALEIELSEVTPFYNDCSNFLWNLKSWMRPKRVNTMGLAYPATSEVRNESFGVVLVIGPYNYPLNLTFIPVVGALAAGNSVVLKPSELCPAFTKLLCSLLPKYIDSCCLRVATGAVTETTQLLSLRWDFVFFTGSPKVGKIVARAAAEYMTPHVLELGGINPIIVDDRVQSIDVVARRIAWGKCFNCGQTCVSPQYVLVLEKQAQPLKELLVKYLEQFYGADPKESNDFGRQQTKDKALRIKELLSSGSYTTLCGGADKVDTESRYVPPTVVAECPINSPLMQEEIFGPVLIVNTVKSIEDAIKYVKQVPGTPLALYVFSSQSSNIEKCFSEIQSGGGMANDLMLQSMKIAWAGVKLPNFICVVVQAVAPNAPLGGVGSSGHGGYHGKHSFECFSQKRTVIHKHLNYNNNVCDPWLRYPPFDKDGLKQRLLRGLARNLPTLPSCFGGTYKS